MKKIIYIVCIFFLLFCSTFLIYILYIRYNYKSWQKKHQGVHQGIHYNIVKEKLKGFNFSDYGVLEKDTSLFRSAVMGPYESSEELYLDFNKDSILVNKKLVH